VHDKRSHQRVPLETTLTYTEAGAGQEIRSANARDISLGGMYIASEARPELGRSLSIKLTLPGNSTVLTLPAVVRWFSDDGFGVQFQLLGAKETHAITRYAQ
jgi:hypothetical protein